MSSSWTNSSSPFLYSCLSPRELDPSAMPQSKWLLSNGGGGRRNGGSAGSGFRPPVVLLLFLCLLAPSLFLATRGSTRTANSSSESSSSHLTLLCFFYFVDLNFLESALSEVRCIGLLENSDLNWAWLLSCHFEGCVFQDLEIMMGIFPLRSGSFPRFHCFFYSSLDNLSPWVIPSLFLVAAAFWLWMLIAFSKKTK